MRRPLRLTVAILLAVALLPVVAAHAVPSEGMAGTAGQGKARPTRSATEVVVRVESSVAMRALEAHIGREGARVLRRSADGESAVIEVPAGRSSAEYARAIASGIPVEVAEPLGYVSASAVPSDPAYSLQWGLQAIHAPGAWDHTWGASTVVVAVIDSGVDLDHTDLVNRIVPGGWDYIDNDAVADDVYGHGTHVAGIIAAQANNSLFGSGTAPGCRILPVRVLNAAGSGDTYTLALAIRYATDHGADVINMSLGGPDFSEDVRLAVAYALDHDVVVVAAAGNTYAATPPVPAVQYPAREAGVLAVGSVGQTLGIASYSNRDSTLDLVAPGGDGSGPEPDIYSTYVGGGAAYMAGTSMATPFVAGTAALIRSVNPALTQLEVASALTATARDLGAAGRDATYGYGIIDAEAAVRSVDPAPVTGIAMNPAAASSGWYLTAPTVTLTPDEPATTYYYWDSDAPAVYPGPLTASEGTHTLTFWSENAGGIEGHQAQQFRVDTVAPTKPTITSAVAAGTTSISLTWSASTDTGSGTAGYAVHASPSGTVVATTAGTSVLVAGLAPATSYSYYVTAHDLASNASFASGTRTVSTASAAVLEPVYRFYNVTNGTHFFTPSIAERDYVRANWPGVYRDEGVAYSTNPANNTQPLFRFYNRVSGSHFYTASPEEADLVSATWPNVFTYEGHTYFVSTAAAPGKIPVYRFFNLKNGSHFFTASAAEADMVIATWPTVYRFEGPAFWLGQ